jgi:hypothetical protein
LMLLLLLMMMTTRNVQPGDVKVESILNNQPDQSYLINSLPSTIFRNYFARPSGCNKSGFVPGTGPY